MRYKHRLHIRNPHVGYIALAVMVALAFFLPLLQQTHVALAATDADYSFSPETGTFTTGSQITVTLSESSSASDDTSSLYADVEYSSDLLQYDSGSAGSFAPCDFQSQPASGGVAELDISCTSTSSVSGTQTVASLTFNVMGAGNASVTLGADSDIDDINGNSLWDGNIPVASYTTEGPGSSSTGSGGGSSGSTGGSISLGTGGSSSSSSGSNSNSSPSGSQSPTSSATSGTTATLSLNVTDSSNKPVKGAQISVNGTQSAVTNAQGNARLEGLTTGNHTVTVTASGLLPSTFSLLLTSGENKSVTVKLTSQGTSTGSVVADICIGLTIIAVLYKYRWKAGFTFQRRPPKEATPGIVVGSGTLTSAEPVKQVSIITPSTQAGPESVTPSNPDPASDQQNSIDPPKP